MIFDCRTLVLYIAANSLQDALAALHEAHVHYPKEKLPVFARFNPENKDVIDGELYREFQHKLVHLGMDSQPFSD